MQIVEAREVDGGQRCCRSNTRLKEKQNSGQHEFSASCKQRKRQKIKKQYTWRQPWSWKSSVGRILPWYLVQGSDKAGFGHRSSENPDNRKK